MDSDRDGADATSGGDGLMGKMLSARKAARHIGMRDETFRNLVEAGVIPKWTDPLTQRVRFSEPRLDEWLRTLDDTKKAS